MNTIDFEKIDLSVGRIDFTKEKVKPNLSLCKPNKTTIAKMNESYDIMFDLKLGALDSLEFKIPVKHVRRHELVETKSFKRIRGKYLVRFKLNSYDEYFVINSINKKGDSEEYLEVKALLLPFELNRKILRSFELTSKNAKEQLEKVLEKTNWKVGYIDSEFLMKYRGLEITRSTVIEAIVNIAKTFNALIVWDTHTETISFYRPNNIGKNRGLRVKYGKLIENVEETDESDNIITRLHLYGKEDIGIQSVNPTGSSYIEDYSTYIYPYKEVLNPDGTYEVLRSSDYMTNELCHSLLAYQKTVKDSESVFQALLESKATLQAIVNQQESDLFSLETTRRLYLDDRDALNTRIAQKRDQLDNADNNNLDTIDLIRGELVDLENQLQNKIEDIETQEQLILDKETEIIYYEQDVQEVDHEIDELRQDLSVNNNFTNQEITEWNRFIHEDDWQDQNITDPQDLLDEGKVAFDRIRQQRMSISVSLFNFLSALEEQNNWDKLNLGDTFRIDYDRLNISYQAKITEIEYDFESEEINVTISDAENLKKDQDRFLEMLYNSYSTSSVVDIDSWKWDLSLENNGKINQLINNIWDANKQAIIGAKDQVVEVSDRGLLIRDPNDPNVYLVGLNGMIAITNDGGNTWKHAITSTGIVGEYIYGKVYMGVNLALEDEDGVLKFQGSKGEIFDRDGNLVMKLGLIDESPDKFGLMAKNAMNRIQVSDLDGFVIDRASTDTNKYPDGWEKVFWTDPNTGTLYSRDIVASNIKIVSGDDWDHQIVNAETGEFNLGFFNTIIKDGKLTTDEKLNLIKELNQISSQYQILVQQALRHQKSSRDNTVDIDGEFNVSQQKFPQTNSSIDLYSIEPLKGAYLNLIQYMKKYLKIESNVPHEPLLIAVNDPMTQETSEVEDRAEFILMFKSYYDEANKLRNEIENAISYSGLNMGTYYNNLLMNDHGFLAIRSDGKYRAFLNATNGLALQKWEDRRKDGRYQWVNKLYASIGNEEFEDGTLVAEDLVARRLIIRDRDNNELLNSDSLVFDFKKLEEIIIDDIIMPTEKVSILNQFKSITKQYNGIIDHANHNLDNVYSDRDSFYTDLNNARNNLISKRNSLETIYAGLVSYLQPVWTDMNKKTDIVIDLQSTRTQFYNKFEAFYEAYEDLRNAIDNFIEKSSLQLGRNYNRTVIDPVNGVVVSGLRGEEVKMNANEGFVINVNGEKRFWIATDGTIRARRLIIEPAGGSSEVILDEETDAYISDLMVNSLKSISADVPQSTVKNYVYIRRNFLKLMRGTSASSDTEKFRLELTGSENYPRMIFGEGNSSNNDRGYIQKQADRFRISYSDPVSGNARRLDFNAGESNSVYLNAQDGKLRLRSTSEVLIERSTRYIKITNDAIRLQMNADNYIEITTSGVKVVGTRIDLN